MTDQNKLYPFDVDSFAVEFNARPDAESPAIVSHRLRRPTFEELCDREGRIRYEMVSVTTSKDEIESDDTAANVWLWNKIITEVKGYDGADDWRELTEDEKARMSPAHKRTAVLGMYAGSCELEGDPHYVPIGPATWTVRQKFGTNEDKPDYVVSHALRAPTEAERLKFKPSTTSYVRGAKKMRVQITTRLRPYVELYDALVERVEGGTVNDEPFSAVNRAQFVAAIDPMWKRQVIQCLMSALEAQLLD
jgi:hypothetical protein